MAAAPDHVFLVSACDKLHNARTIISDLADPAIGLAVFDRFKGGREGTLWYYRSLAEAIPDRISVKHALHDEVNRMHNLSGDSVATHAREHGNA